MSDGEQSEAARVGAQGGGHHFRVATVVLGARQREAVAEAIHLLWVNGVNLKPTLDQRFNHRPMRHLDRDLDLRGVDHTACRHQPGRHLGKPFAAVLENPFSDFPAITVREEHMMALRRPVDAGVALSLFDHAFSPVRAYEPP